MASRTKVTPFARLFLFLIIFAPLAYIGAAYIKGEDGLEAVKNLFKGEENTTISAEDKQVNEEKTMQLEQLKEELEKKEQRIKDLEAENEELKKANEALKNGEEKANEMTSGSDSQ